MNLDPDLFVKKEKVESILFSKGIKTAPTMQVVLAVDISASMTGIISSGRLQKAVDQIMGVGVTFDDDGNVPVYQFDDRCDYVAEATVGNYKTFLRDNRVGVRGGTAYSPIIQKVVAAHFATNPVAAAAKGMFAGLFKKPSGAATYTGGAPVLLIIITDGEPARSDIPAIRREIEAAQRHNIYIHLVGVGGERLNFPTIAKLADDYPNVGEVYLPSFDMSDDAVYEQVICDELIEWVGKFAGQSAAKAS